MNIEDLRRKIDAIDENIIDCFCKRMEIASAIADHKRENDLPIHVPQREEAVLDRVAQQAGPEFSDAARQLYKTIFQISRDHQQNRNSEVEK